MKTSNNIGNYLANHDSVYAAATLISLAGTVKLDAFKHRPTVEGLNTNAVVVVEGKNLPYRK